MSRGVPSKTARSFRTSAKLKASLAAEPHRGQPIGFVEPGAGSVLCRSRMNKKQGGNFAALSPTDFIAAVTKHIPDKRFQLVRYYGWHSNKARGVRAKTGAAQAEDSLKSLLPTVCCSLTATPVLIDFRSFLDHETERILPGGSLEIPSKME
jgi:hypothetical protein